MRSSKWMLIGASAVAAGVLMLGMAYATSGVVHAGTTQPTCDGTQVPDNLGQISTAPDLAMVSQRLPDCTETPSPTPFRRLKTHTPTASATPTNTEVPKTNTPVPPTSTPKAASEAVSVKPPNTGSGSGGSGNMTLWLLALGAAAVLLGGGTVLVGVRRR